MKLNQILHVPSITKNLLSISKLTSENNVIVEFYSDLCVVKGKVTRAILFQLDVTPCHSTKLKTNPRVFSVQGKNFNEIISKSALFSDKIGYDTNNVGLLGKF